MTRRTERVSEAIREVVAQAILFELKDPRVTGVTVIKAEVTGDLRHAKIFVSLMGTEAEQKLSLRGLESARGFLQRKVAERLETRYTPHIDLVVDESVKKSLEIARLLREANSNLTDNASDELSSLKDPDGGDEKGPRAKNGDDLPGQ